jgi:hypothetical protein
MTGWRQIFHEAQNFNHVQSKKMWRACNLTAFTTCLTRVQWTTRLLPVMGDLGSIPRGYLCETRILLLALSGCIGDPDMIDHCGLVLGGLRPELSLGPRADNVIIPLDLTQLLSPSFMLAAGPPSSFTPDIVSCWGELCGEPAISLHSHHVSLV